MLEAEGFRYQGLVDIFDAGPTVACPRDDIRTVRDARWFRARVGDIEGSEALVSAGEIQRFRAVRTATAIKDEQATISRDAAEVLGVREGDRIRVKA